MEKGQLRTPKFQLTSPAGIQLNSTLMWGRVAITRISHITSASYHGLLHFRKRVPASRNPSLLRIKCRVLTIFDPSLTFAGLEIMCKCTRYLGPPPFKNCIVRRPREGGRRCNQDVISSSACSDAGAKRASIYDVRTEEGLINASILQIRHWPGSVTFEPSVKKSYP